MSCSLTRLVNGDAFRCPPVADSGFGQGDLMFGQGDGQGETSAKLLMVNMDRVVRVEIILLGKMEFWNSVQARLRNFPFPQKEFFSHLDHLTSLTINGLADTRS